MTRDDRLRIAVFIDFDNIEIGVKNTLGASFDAGLVLEALKERGDVVSKTAYSDWQRAGGYSRSLTQHAIKMVQRNLTPGGDKNGADINLALDALEMAFTHPHINAFVIVGGDSDFISLVEKLKQYDKKIFVVGGRQFTSIIMQRNCHEFIAYENLVGASGASSGGRRPAERGVRVERVPIDQAIPLVQRGLKVLADREVSPQLGLLKSTLLQLDSTFSERSYGAGSFRDFVEKLEKIGVLKLQQVKGSLLVTASDDAPMVVSEAGAASSEDGELNGDVVSEGASVVPFREPREPREPREAREPREGDEGRDDSGRGRPQGPAPDVIGSNADGIREFKHMLATGEVRRWPMYLRNVKQLFRSVNPEFDERAYGFANLVDLLRAAARENIVRVDRDRQGVIRVFQGNVPVEVQPPVKKIFDIEDELAAEAAAAGAQAVASIAERPEVLDVTVVETEHVLIGDEVRTIETVVSTPPAAPPLPVLDIEEDEDEPNFNRPGAGGDEGELAAIPVRKRTPAAARRRPGVKPVAAAGRERAPRGGGPRGVGPRTPRARKSTKR
ncbi:MAG: NYN domain-containing protein [Acidobacteria bacterium]|nr:NYN domain-containing protein [Acidobacteriota bacterium]